MSNDTVILIAVEDIRSKIKGETNLIRRLRGAMRAAQDFWLSADDELRLRAALAAAVLESPPEEAERITRSTNALQSLARAMSGGGAAIDLDQFVGLDPLPLMKLWREAKHPTAATTAEVILEEAAADYPDTRYYVAAQRLVPAMRSVDVHTHERVEAALKLTRLDGVRAAADALVGADTVAEAAERLRRLSDEQ